MYGLRIRIEYKDINEVLTRINIFQEDYTDSADIRYAHAAIRIDWGDQNVSGMPLVYGSGCTVFFDSESDYEFLYLFTSDARKHLVTVEKAGTLFWTGFIEPDSWSEPLIAAPYPVQCTAYDGLGFLKDVRFADIDPEGNVGKKTMFDLVQICLLQTGLDLTINTAIDWKEQLQGAGTDLLKVHKATCENYAESTCYEVLEDILDECRIFQRSGQWWIISNSQWGKESFEYFITTPAGAISTGMLNPRSSGFWFENEPSMEMLSAVKQFIDVQDFGYNANLATNGSFSDYDEELSRFKGWINNYVTPEQRTLNDQGDTYIYIPGKEYLGTLHDEKYGLMTHSVEKRMNVVETESIMNIALKYACMGTGYASLMFIKVKLVGATESYYLRRVRYFETTEVPWEWVNYNDKLSLGDDMITLKSHLKESAYTGITLPHPYYNTYDNVTAYPATTIVDHFESFKASVTGLPITGSLQLQLFVPYTDRAQIAGACYAGVKIELMDETEQKYPVQKSFKIVNNIRNNFVPDERTSLLGDYPDLPNSDIIYRGGISRLDDSHTTLWTLDGLNFYTYVELMARMKVAGQRKPRMAYKVRVADLIPRLNMVIDDVNNPGILLVENGISYDDSYQAAEGRYTEILDMDFTDQTVETAIEFDNKTNQRNSTTVVNPVTVGGTAAVMDEKGAIISNNSYFDSDYFTTIIDENTGISKIISKVAQVVNNTYNETTIINNSETTIIYLGQNPSQVSVRVYLNGIRQHYSTYTVNGNTVTLNQAPETGDLVQVFYEAWKADVQVTETATGAIDGANKVFTLSDTPEPTSLNVFLNGVLLHPSQYSIAGDTVTLNQAPYPGDTILVDFLTSAASGNIYNETPSGAINGSNASYTLAYVPTAGTVKLYLNGVRQLPGVDFTIAADLITFAVAPFAGDWIIVDYSH